MEEFLRPYTEEELEDLLQQSGYSEIARTYCLEELNYWCEYIISDEIHWAIEELNYEKKLENRDIPDLVRVLTTHLKWKKSTVREEAWNRVISGNKINIYLDQIAQGRPHGWATKFAEELSHNPLSKNIYKDVYHRFINYHYAEKELMKIAKELIHNRSDVFSSFIALLLRDVDELDIEQLVKSFEIYDNLIQDGKSDLYAAAYFYYYWNNSHDAESCSVYADCVNVASINCESLEDAIAFGNDIMDHWSNGYFVTEINRFKELYLESWAREKFYELMVKHEEMNSELPMSTLLKNEFRKDLQLPPISEE